MAIKVFNIDILSNIALGYFNLLNSFGYENVLNEPTRLD